MRFRLKHLTWREFARRFYHEWETDAVPDGAAQLSYYFLFSLFPLLFCMVTLLAYLPIGTDTVNQLLERVNHLMPGEALDLVRQHLDNLIHQPRPKLLTGALFVALWSASRGTDALRKALNLAYDVTESRPLWRTQLIAMGMTVAGAVLIPIGFTVFLLGGKVGELIAEKLQLVDEFIVFWSWLRWPFTAAVVMLTLALSYFLLPDVKQRFRYITPGSMFGTVGWLASTWAFTQYVDHFGKYNVTYGSIGGVVVLLLWLYITGMIFIVGGELNAILEHASPSAQAKNKGARVPGEPSPVEPPVKTPGAAKTKVAAEKTRWAFWRWRRRVAQGKPPEPTEKEQGLPPAPEPRDETQSGS